jgi:site-specific DNA-cytosine methylase
VSNPGNIRVLVACEYSATVRDAFIACGFNAWSCDILPTEGDPAFHIQDDLRHVLTSSRWSMWDLIISHPPCTHLAVSGARHFAEKQADGRQQEALDFVRMILAANAAHIALENPVSIISSHIRKPDQTIQPWQFGHGEVKATCLWLKNLPLLRPTHVEGGDLFTPAAPIERDPRVWRMPPGPDRWKERSRTYRGIADAMAQQWGDYLLSRHSRDIAA